MASTKCKCVKPDGGGTTCPDKHIAICVRARDRECYGECIAVPASVPRSPFISLRDSFEDWAEIASEEAAKDYVLSVDQEVSKEQLMQFDVNRFRTEDGGTITFSHFSLGKIYVRYFYDIKTRNDFNSYNSHKNRGGHNDISASESY